MNLLRRAVWLGLVLALALLRPGGARAQDQGVAVITSPLEGAILSGLVPIAGYLGSDQGGLGQLIFTGLNRFFNTPLLVGAVLTVALAVALDLTIVSVQRALTPWTRRRGADA